ncbi:MAG TPA: substrate-binding domain-containing protein, partial [Pirellula sp.]|nr:substrate-binding domain-containing protein [Pirellula sp.]
MRIHAGGSDYHSRLGSINFKVFLVAALLASIALVGLLSFGNPKKSSSLQINRTIELLAAAGLREPIEKIARNYEVECGVKVDIQFGGSNSLLSQIKVDRIGTPDLLLVADEFYTQKAVEGNLAQEVLSIAVQRPCVIVPKDSTIQIRSVDDLMVSGR